MKTRTRTGSIPLTRPESRRRWPISRDRVFRIVVVVVDVVVPTLIMTLLPWDTRTNRPVAIRTESPFHRDATV